MSTNPQWQRLADDLIRATDNVHGATGREYHIAVHVYEMAKQALADYEATHS